MPSIFCILKGGNLNKHFPKIQMPGGPGGMLKLRFDRYIMKESGEPPLVSDHLRLTFSVAAYAEKFDCTSLFSLLVLPTIPRSLNVAFVNQSAVELRWLPPAITGDQTHVYYDVDCRKSCDNDDDKECLDEACESVINYFPHKKGLSATQVMVTSLTSFVNYTFKVYSKNRVTEVAQRRHGVEGKFTAITVRTNGSGKFFIFHFAQYIVTLINISSLSIHRATQIRYL